MATINYSRVQMPELRTMVKALNAVDLTKRPIATRGKPTREAMAEEFVHAIEECASNGTLDDVPEDVYNYYTDIMVPDDDEGEADPDVNEDYIRDDLDDLVDEYRGKKKRSQDETVTEIPEDEEGSLLDDPEEDEDDSEEEEYEEDDDPEEDEDSEEEDDDPEEEEPDPEPEEEPEPPKRKRGRPKKVVAEKTEEAPKRKRGRPPKTVTKDEPKKKLGRPPKTKTVTKKAAPKTKTTSRIPKPKKMGKTKPSGRAKVFYEVIQSKTPLTKDQIVDAMLEKGYSLEDNRLDALFWTKEYLDLMVQIGIIEKRGEGKSSKYVFVG